jgi:hypothetical protein
MLFRVLMLCTSILIVLGILTQVLWPAFRSRPLFPLFKGESRLQRAERLRVEALERKQAAQREAAALHATTEAEAVDVEIIQRLTKR